MASDLTDVWINERGNQELTLIKKNLVPCVYEYNVTMLEALMTGKRLNWNVPGCGLLNHG